MLFVVCLIAVLNLCLGFVTAVHLGYGPPSVADAWHVLFSQLPFPVLLIHPDNGSEFLNANLAYQATYSIFIPLSASGSGTDVKNP